MLIFPGMDHYTVIKTVSKSDFPGRYRVPILDVVWYYAHKFP